MVVRPGAGDRLPTRALEASASRTLAPRPLVELHQTDERAGEPFTAADAAVLTRRGPKATAVRASATAAVASVAAAIAAALRRSH